MKTLAIILGILLALCLIGTGIFYLYYRHQKKKWIAAAEDNLRAGKEEAADIIRRTMDTVNDDKKRMEAMADKDILIEAMTALAAQHRRLDRMEEKMEVVVSYTASIDAMNKLIEAIGGDLDALQTQFKEASSLVVSSRQAVQGLNTAVAQFNTTLGKTEDVQKQLTSMTDAAQKTLKQLEGVDTKANTVVTETNKMFAAYKDGPMEQLRALDAQLTSVRGTLDALTGKVDQTSTALAALRQTQTPAN